MAFSEFQPLDDKSLVDYIKATPSLSSKLKNHLDDLKIKEVGDGNLNFVFIVVGSHGSLVFKQVELCRLTEQVVFSDPYKVSEYNRWTSPYLDSDAEAVLEDYALKLEVAELKSL